VLWDEGKCWSPIAEFPTWGQAQMWADTEAGLAAKNDKERSLIGEEEKDT
jgi:hypothetical protein